MALMTEQFCIRCVDTTEHINGVCTPCNKMDVNEKKLKRDNKFSALDIEGKLNYLYKRSQLD